MWSRRFLKHLPISKGKYCLIVWEFTFRHWRNTHMGNTLLLELNSYPGKKVRTYSIIESNASDLIFSSCTPKHVHCITGCTLLLCRLFFSNYHCYHQILIWCCPNKFNDKFWTSTLGILGLYDSSSKFHKQNKIISRKLIKSKCITLCTNPGNGHGPLNKRGEKSTLAWIVSIC